MAKNRGKKRKAKKSNFPGNPSTDQPPSLFPSISRQNRSKNRLWALPQEIRWIIYELLLLKPEVPIALPSPVYPTGGVCGMLEPTKAKVKATRRICGLLEVSKAIRHDAAQFFYEQNNFVLGWCKEEDVRPRFVAKPNGLESFLAVTPQFYIGCIRKLTILVPLPVFPYPDSSSTMSTETLFAPFKDMTTATLKNFPNLRVVNITFTEFIPTMLTYPWEEIEDQVFDSLSIFFQHHNLKKIIIGVDLIGKPLPPSSLQLPWDPIRDVFNEIKKAIKRAMRGQNGIWSTKESRWNEIFIKTRESRFLEPELWTIVKKRYLMTP
ncbi:hypothetical protein DSL72_001068 [Monilinia vaccinii-corymbosi]|uniref:Uncharacterized protein n=1 Tax=Monilinia vaccinii-corymbosi TaxID=61207 RepID=A0A8A3P793_9HELO|nr:hypothetical protein DSL72_001068 [Monilinia vaccinii-corymbosi]